MLEVKEDELFCVFMVDDRTLVISETCNAIRALTNHEHDVASSIAATGRSLGIDATADALGRR